MEASKKFGEIIRSIRENRLKMTQKEFSEQLNITTVYVSYIEQGKRPPSKDLLKSIYSLVDEEVPEEITEMLGEAKKNKKKENMVSVPTDIIYELEEKNLYKYPLLKNLLKENPGDLIAIYGILRLLIEEGKKKEAKRHLLKYLMKVEKLEDKRWLEASYYELEGNFPIAITFLLESLKEFDKNTPNPDDKLIKIKAGMIFQLASMYYRQGQQLYYKDENVAAVENFQNSLKWHEEIRKVYREPFYQMEYAGIFLWLALLGINPHENWNSYIVNGKEALFFNHYKGMSNFSFSEWKGLYSKQYLVSTVSFIARAYGHLALFEKNENKKLNFINEGEFLLAQHTPVDISLKYQEYYRFYFNEACFYSLKAEVFEGLKKPFDEELERSHISLLEAKFADENNSWNFFAKEVQSSGGLNFYRKKKSNDLDALLKK